MSHRSNGTAAMHGRARNAFAALLLALCGADAHATKVDIAGPPESGEFGAKVFALANGNFVVTDTDYDGNGGAVHFYSRSGTRMSTLVYGSSEDLVFIDILQLKSGDVLLVAPYWDNGPSQDAGAVTWVDGDTGLDGTVNASNSLVGTHSNDRVGGYGVKRLANGNYVVFSSDWTRDNGGTLVSQVGAITFGRGDRPLTGAVSIANSLVGSRTDDMDFLSVDFSVFELANGHFVISNRRWDNGTIVDAGAVTWASGTTGIMGEITTANSFVGTHTTDLVGAITPLTDGSYVVHTAIWDDGVSTNVGAAARRPGNGPAPGIMSVANALTGASTDDLVAGGGVTALAGGAYLVASPQWRNPDTNTPAVGAVTRVAGGAAAPGKVAAANSLTGSAANDKVGEGGFVTLTNGNVVVRTPKWDLGPAVDAGAVTVLTPTATRAGEQVSLGNSLTGSSANDEFSAAIALANGNFAVACGRCDVGTMVDAGVATWGDGNGATTGPISIFNSLVGSSPGDFVGEVVVPLTNGNYVVRSRLWDNLALARANAGAATWVDGTSGFTRTGTSPGDIITEANSLIGTHADDQIGGSGIFPLANGGYVVGSQNWDNGVFANVGASTYADAVRGIAGPVRLGNSLIGASVDDGVGGGVLALPNGNYVIASRSFDSVVGQQVFANAGAVTWVAGDIGISGTVSRANSLIPSGNASAFMGLLHLLPNGDYVVRTPNFDNCLPGPGCASDAGLVNFGRASGGLFGIADAGNGVAGQSSGGGTALSFDYNTKTDQLIVGRPEDNVVTLFDDGLLRDGFE